MKVYAATIHHKHGVDLCLASSEAGRLAKIADYCRANWNDAVGIGNPDYMPNDRVVELYFAPEAMGDHEYAERYEPEDVD